MAMISGNDRTGRKGGKSISVGTKIYAIVGLCLVLMFAVAGTGIWQMRMVGKEIEAIAERDTAMIASLTKLTVHQLEQAIDFERGMRLAEELDRHPEIRGELDGTIEHFRKYAALVDKEFVDTIALAKYATETSTTAAERKIFEHIAEDLTALAELHKTFDTDALKTLELASNGQLEDAFVLIEGVEVQQTKLDHDLENLLFEIEEFTVEAALTAEEHEKFAQQLMTWITVIAMLVAVILSVLLVRRSVTGPLRQIVSGLDALNRDDLSVDVRVASNDEMGTIADSYSAFKDNLMRARELEAEQKALEQRQREEEERERQKNEERAREQSQVTESFSNAMTSLAANDLSFRIGGEFPPAFQSLKDDFNNAMDKLSTTMEEIGSASEQMLSGSREIHTAVDSLARRNEQQAASVEETAAAVSETTTAMKSASERAVEASGLASEARDNAEKSGLVVQDAINAMKKIEESAEKITNIIAVIDEISFQTNLLALNAGVEAARAGEAGKGFAVVAQEVRELAQRSSDAAKEIKTLIDSSGEDVKAGVTLVNKTGSVLETIVSQVKEIDLHVQSISGSAKEQAVGLQEINGAVNNIDEGTQQNAAVSEEASAASQMLAEEVGRVNVMLSAFDTGKMSGLVKQKTEESALNGAEGKSPPPVRLATGFDGNAAIAADNENWDEF
ncbi:HAMP domain-containing methyl-accepting chemotaxis protein [Nitratireductor sp. XY-223]|uniref:HAMP domain-containing methyl-accepting chemotaxis protein n=1 Tax=Nitratireductor sp. XY-223 TaxID=2561926 RepID=UPI00145C14FE|nr:HAMP domain-containing methyl-accepting chemotaxis protein [Nitratireductor sp. XY-223]